ncbi:retrotransposon protein, putative, ty1-copia subclass [Tanacetum coccineum]
MFKGVKAFSHVNINEYICVALSEALLIVGKEDVTCVETLFGWVVGFDEVLVAESNMTKINKLKRWFYCENSSAMSELGEASTYDVLADDEGNEERWKEMYRNKCVIKTHSDEHIECKENEAPRKLVADEIDEVDTWGNLVTNGDFIFGYYPEANSNGSSFWNVKTSSTSTTPIVDKIGKIEKLIIDGKVTLVDDDGKPLKKIDYPGDHDKKWMMRLNWRYENLIEKVAYLKKNLKDIQVEVEKHHFNCDLKQRTVKVLNEYMKASNDELKLLQQKAKIKWLSKGDQNTTYFHGILKSRNHKGRIESICDENGIRYDSDKVAKGFVEHFKNFFGTKQAVQPLSYVDINFEKVISKDEAKDMISMVTNYEIKKEIFDIDSNKASGPDGYTFGFFKKAWSIIGKELQKVVNLNPSAFIPERHIQDNILIAQELLKGYKSKNSARRRALKIDIQKAYDTISWDFLKEDIKAIHNDSCGWKKLLDLRSRIKNHVFYSVGNGMNVSMWFDRWDIKGLLSDIIPRRVWFPDPCNINVPLLSNDDTDKVWLNNQNEKKEFFTKQAWCDLRDNIDKVDWYHVVWFNEFQPRHAFILWLAILKRLATQDRLAKWNCISNLECTLCNKERDSHAHLFFKCDYSKLVLGMLKRRLMNMSNQDELKIVYFIWQERNWRMFKKERRFVEQILKFITENVKLSLMSFKARNMKDKELEDARGKRSCVYNMWMWVADTQKIADVAAGTAVIGYNMEDLESLILTVEQAIGRSSFFEVPSILYPSQVGKIQIEEEADLGRGKGQRKVGSYREAYAPKPMDTLEDGLFDVVQTQASVVNIWARRKVHQRKMRSPPPPDTQPVKKRAKRSASNNEKKDKKPEENQEKEKAEGKLMTSKKTRLLKRS